VKIHSFTRKLQNEWRRLSLPETGGRVVAGVSGGADSMALWLALDELRGAGRLNVEIVVAHFNHGLREESAEDECFVARTAEQRGSAFVSGAGLVSRRGNLEQEARRARYAFLQTAAEAAGAAYLLTAHTLDDQAETVLLNLLRGAGPDGLSGMKPLRPLHNPSSLIPHPSSLILARPLLRWARRAETVDYCRARGLEPLRDAMNEDEGFARVRLRRSVLPLLSSFNGRIAEALGRTAELLQADQEVLQHAAAELLQKAAPETSSGAGLLRVDILRPAPEALRLRALRLWLEQGRGDLRRLELKHARAVERLLEEGRGGRVAELPGGAKVTRRRGALIFHAASKTEVEKGRAGG
jgi:tRNA(Ile)-lysidine synthase